MLSKTFKPLLIGLMAGCFSIGTAQAAKEAVFGDHVVTLKRGVPVAVDGQPVVKGPAEEDNGGNLLGGQAADEVNAAYYTDCMYGYCDVMEARDDNGNCNFLLVQHGYYYYYHWHLVSCSSWEYYYQNAALGHYNLIVNSNIFRGNM